MTKIKIGIIGYGSWVKKAYIPALKKDDRAEIIAISARSENTIKSIKEDFGISIDIYKGYKDLLASPKIEAVMIAVPDFVHAEIISATLAANKAVFYEPPIAHTRVLLPKIIKSLLRTPLITYADLELALVPAIAKAADLIKRKVIGNVQTVSIKLQSQ